VSAAAQWPSARLLAVVAVLRAEDPVSIVSTPIPRLELDFGGVVGDRHHGLTRTSDPRQLRYYPRGTLIRNRRQLSLVAVEELAEIAGRSACPGWSPAGSVPTCSSRGRQTSARCPWARGCCSPVAPGSSARA
jgi:hypothetical protein